MTPHPTYCARCGQRLLGRRIDGRERMVCPACSQVAWLNPVPAAAAIVLRDDRVLLVKRSIEPLRGSWTLPAGYQEADEPPHATAEREVMEECGLCVRAYGLYDVQLTVDDPRKPAILVSYLCRDSGGRPRALDDAAEAGFFPLDDLPGPIGFENNRRLLRRLAREVPRRALRFVPVRAEDDA